MSTLVAQTISDGTNSTSSTNCIQGSAKAWVNFTGSSGSVNASYNVSSVTRSSTGLYVVNFTNALTDANYGVTFGICGGTSAFGTNAAFVGSVIAVSQYGAPNNKTTTACQIGTNDYTATARDFGQVYVAFNR
jgi:N-methylhydantoinase B/oxoprolinase/acetone carboxylase alpha subunit